MRDSPCDGGRSQGGVRIGVQPTGHGEKRNHLQCGDHPQNALRHRCSAGRERQAAIIADKTTDDVHERIFRCTFSLKPLSYSNTAAYYLIIADTNGQQLSREEFQIDIAFAVADDDFFG